MNNCFIYTDGGSRGNPGKSAIGGVIKTEAGEILAEISEYIGIQTNNYAEYKALEVTLQRAIRLGVKSAIVYLDSKLVVEQVNGRWKINNDQLRILCNKIKEMISSFDKVSFIHIKRHLNKEADFLVNKALDNKQENDNAVEYFLSQIF